MTQPAQPLDVGDSLVEVIVEEFTDRWHQGERPSAEDYAARYPHLAEVLRKALQTFEALQSPAPSSTMAGQGKTADTDPSSLAGPQQAPTDYEILAELGRGGMGVVYKARQRSLDRLVALKMVHAGSDATADDRARFRREALAAAAIRHEGIVQIYEVGETQGAPFLAQELVEGGSLATKAQGQPQDPRWAAALVEQLSRAVQAAHTAGLVHRDLKPANVLLTADGTPKVADFGLVKRLTGDSLHTQTDVMVGTPSYMAPEQAAPGLNVGAAADIHALGAILYEMLTGRAPFRGATILDTLAQVRDLEPVSPRLLQPTCPRDLEVICLKCLRKEPEKRYASAAALAADLQAFREGRPIEARPISAWARGWKWAKRHPAAAALTAMTLVALLTLVGLAVNLTYSQKLSDANDKLSFALNEAKTARSAEEEAKTKIQDLLAREQLFRTNSAVRLAHGEWHAGNVVTARKLLNDCPKETRSWEWRLLHAAFHAEKATWDMGFPIYRIAVSPDGRWIAAGARDDEKKRSETIEILDRESGKVVHALPGPSTLTIMRLVFSPDSRFLASCAGGPVTIWDVITGKTVLTYTEHKARVIALSFHPNGEHLASAGADKTIRVWNHQTGKLFASLPVPFEPRDLAFHPEGKLLTCAAADQVVAWDCPFGTSQDKPRVIHKGKADESVQTLAYSNDARYLVIISKPNDVSKKEGRMKIVDAKRKTWFEKPWNALLPHRFSLSPDGEFLAACAGNTLELYPRSARFPELYRGHAGALTDVVFTPDSAGLVSAAGQTVSVWDATRGQEARLLRTGNWTACLAFSADGALLATGHRSPGMLTHEVIIWEVASGKHLARIATPKVDTYSVALSSDKKYLAAAFLTGVIKVWDWRADKEVLHIPGHKDRAVPYLEFTPDGHLACVCKTLTMWEVPSGREILSLPGHACFAFSADGEQLALAEGNTVILLQARTKELVRTFHGHKLRPAKIAFSKDGRLLLSSTNDALFVWDVASGSVLHKLPPPGRNWALSPDGTRLITADLKVWDLTLGIESITLDRAARDMFVAFSPDGKRVASGSFHSEALKLWGADD